MKEFKFDEQQLSTEQISLRINKIITFLENEIDKSINADYKSTKRRHKQRVITHDEIIKRRNRG